MRRNCAEWISLFCAQPLLAILRGITLTDVDSIAQTLLRHDLKFVEVSLTTTAAWDCIEALQTRYGDQLCVGAGTITQPAHIDRLCQLSAPLSVMPHCDRTLIEYAVQRQRVVMPGVATPTEAFAALAAGAHVLKVFPAEMVSAAVLKSWRSVLPRECLLMPVGGISAENMSAYWHSGANAFGLGAALYREGDNAETINTKTARCVESWRNLNKRI